MDKKKIVISLAAVAILALGVWWLNPKSPGEPGDRTTALVESGGTTVGEVPKNVVIPEKESENLPENLAKPEVVTPAGPNTTSNFRSFVIKAEGNKYIPDTVIVRERDTIHIEMTAVDRNYDFTQPDYGFKAKISKGKTGIIEFQALRVGRFAFFCESCGGPGKGPVGTLIVAEKESRQ